MNSAELYKLLEELKANKLSTAEAISAILQTEPEQPASDLTLPRILWTEHMPDQEVLEQVKAATARGQNVLLDSLDMEGADILVSIPEFEYYPLARLGRVLVGPPTHRAGFVMLISGTLNDSSVVEAIEVSLETFGVDVTKSLNMASATPKRWQTTVSRMREASFVLWVAGTQMGLINLFASQLQVPMIAVPSTYGMGIGCDDLTSLRTLIACRPAGVVFVSPNDGTSAAIVAARWLRVDQQQIEVRSLKSEV